MASLIDGLGSNALLPLCKMPKGCVREDVKYDFSFDLTVQGIPSYSVYSSVDISAIFLENTAE